MDTEPSLSPEQIDELLEVARQAREHAYAPYSNFRVGAALLTAGGRIVAGCNVENASYGLTLCAERVAIGNALVQGERVLEAIAIIAEQDDGPVLPCGGCRQVMAEFNPLLTVITANTAGLIKIFRLDELLPYHFNFIVR